MSEGNYTIIFYCSDTLGNRNNNSIEFQIDRTYPTIIFNANTDSIPFVNKNYIIINVSAADTNLNYTIIKIYNSSYNLINATTYNSQVAYINYTVPKDGQYFFNATAYDKAGNKNSTQTRNITIDRINPTITINSPANTTYNITTILVNISSNGDNIWFYNGTANEIYTSPVNITFADGSYTITAYTNDSAGNTNYTSITFSIDTTAPFITFNSPSSITSSTSSNTFNVTASDQNILNVTIYVYNNTGFMINYTSGISNAYLILSLSN